MNRLVCFQNYPDGSVVATPLCQLIVINKSFEGTIAPQRTASCDSFEWNSWSRLTESELRHLHGTSFEIYNLLQFNLKVLIFLCWILRAGKACRKVVFGRELCRGELLADINKRPGISVTCCSLVILEIGSKNLPCLPVTLWGCLRVKARYQRIGSRNKGVVTLKDDVGSFETSHTPFGGTATINKHRVVFATVTRCTAEGCKENILSHHLGTE